MRRTIRNQEGFSIVEALLFALVIAILGFTGWYVYCSTNSASNANSSSNSTQTVAAGQYDGWKTYSDSYASFKYPSGWYVGTGEDKYAAVSIDVTSPAQVINGLTKNADPGTPIVLSLHVGTSPFVSCTNNDDPCKVALVVPLHNPQLPHAAFAVVDQTSGNGTQYSQYAVVNDTVKLGDTTIDDLKVGKSSLYIFGQPYNNPQNGGLSIASRLTDASALQGDGSFKDLIKLINSISFK